MAYVLPTGQAASMNQLFSLSAIECSRLREAAQVLVAHGIVTPALSAVQRYEWPELLRVQLVTDIAAHAQTASQLGVDVAMLPHPPANAPIPGTIGGRDDSGHTGDVTHHCAEPGLQDVSEVPGFIPGHVH